MLSADKNWVMLEDAGRGYRRVVPSPKPIEIVEEPVIRELLARNFLVIAAGGGGIPVSREQDGTLRGVEAVIDKDLTASLLANSLKADTLLDLTAVERVKLNFGRSDEQEISTMCLKQAKQFLCDGHFAPGSMRPKIEAAIQFLEAGGKRVIITLPEKAFDALEGKTGTKIIP
jgi:carbamate kinase